MKKIHYIIVSVLAVFITFFACSKEAEFLDNFFKLTKSQNNTAIINYQEPTAVNIIPDYVVTGDVYKFSYTVTNGNGFLRYANQNELSQNTQHTCQGLALDLEFIGTEIGAAVIIFSVTDYNGASEDILLSYNVVHNPFEWEATSEVTDAEVNQQTSLNLLLNNVGVDQSVTYLSKITFEQGSGILEFTDDSGSSTTEIEQGESYPIEEAEHLYNLTFDQTGVAIIKFEGTDSNGQIKEETLTYNVGEDDIFSNTEQSQDFTKNDCTTGVGSTETYTVAAGTYQSIVSQADADQQAIDDINANGQTYANTNGTCTTTYTNAEQSQDFIKNDCPNGGVGSTETYTVAAGTYQSTVSQADADQQALDDIAANGQAYANTNGTCTTTYTNAEQSQDFTKDDCTTGVGSTETYTVPAGTYQSTVSQADADQQALDDIAANGQTYANTNGTCTTTYTNAEQSQDFVKNDCTGTGVGSTVTFTVPAGTYQSTVSQADADQQAIDDINANGQTYANTNGTCTATYTNTEQSQDFVKNDCTGTGVGSTVTFTVPAGTYQSTVSQADANQQAIDFIVTNGQEYANANGTCIYNNTEQSQDFIKNDCPNNGVGSTETYTVPAGTYQSTVSQADADQQALDDIANNGQTYANTNGTCTTTYTNAEQSQDFVKNDCTGTGVGSTVTFTVPAGTYQSTVSQADADQQAIDFIVTNGQEYANANGTCTYNNTEQSQDFTKNDCTTGVGSTETYTVAAGTYQSTVSQADANQQAFDDINANGQTYANTNGTCNISYLNKTVNFNYNSSAASQNEHVHIFTLNEITAGHSSTNGIQNIRILTLPNRGELAGQGNPITSTPTDFSEVNISSGYFIMWGDDTDGNGQPGSYTTQFTYAIVDNNGVDTDIVTMTLNATDIAPANIAPTVEISHQGNGVGDVGSQPFYITSSDADGTISSWTIDWGDGQTSSGTGSPPQNLNHNYTSPGTNTITITVTDNGGLTGSDSMVITISQQLVPVQIKIHLGTCSNPNFSNSVYVYILKPQTQINSGFITIENGDVLYTNASVTTPFNGGNNGYLYRGIPPNQVTNEFFIVSTTGVISAHEICPTTATAIFVISDGGDDLDTTYIMRVVGSPADTRTYFVRWEVSSNDAFEGSIGLYGNGLPGTISNGGIGVSNGFNLNTTTGEYNNMSYILNDTSPYGFDMILDLELFYIDNGVEIIVDTFTAEG